MKEDWAELRSRFGDAVVKARHHSVRQRRDVEASRAYGCFYCMRRFAPDAIEDWLEEEGTALYRHCGIDSVIGDASSYVTSAPFLARMREAWFKPL